MPSPTTCDFNFHGGRSSPWLYCVSAPSSPNRAPREFDDSSAAVDEFAFHVSEEDAKPTVCAAELFHGGKILPLRPPERDQLQLHGGGCDEVETTTSIRSPLASSCTSPISSKSKEDPNWSKARETIWSAFTPKRNKQTIPHAPRSLMDDDDDDDINIHNRGRERVPCLSTSASRRRGTRSLSPIRLPDYPEWEVEGCKRKKESNSASTELTLVQPPPSKFSRMRKLGNFLLFRSASEGRASDKIERPFKKLAALYRSRRSEADKASSGSSSKPIRSAAVSAHERHYAMKKAASEDMKKKTFLPYKRGILGR